MAHLAIKGHATRGREVIELLEMLGGKNHFYYDGTFTELIYTIGSELELDIFNINYLNVKNDYIVFTLEEFLEKFPYKVGDKVKCWINGYCSINNIKDIQWDSITNEIKYKIQDYWYSTMNLQPYKEETVKEKADTSMAPILQSEDYSGKRFGYKIPKGYEFDCIKENEIIIKPIKPQYPKTYEECCNVLGVNPSFDIRMLEDEESALYFKFIDLVRCRNAYWKIAGEQMGLGESWEPDWNHNTEKYVIYPYQYLYSIDKENYRNTILAFPTKEMRDTFYENFKELIELCKELL